MEGASHAEPTGERRAVYTVGHSTRASEELVGLLAAHGVRTLVDVRRFPGSTRHPWFNRETLEETLRSAGIGYLHMPALGGRRGRADPDSPNSAWRVEAFRAYADHLASPGGRAALDELASLARETVVAYMCAEAVPWRCHRRLVSDALTARGWEVRHILGEKRADRHEMHEAARILPGARIVYPAPEDEQRRLL